MFLSICLIAVAAFGLVVALQARSAFGGRRGLLIGGILVLLPGASWCALDWAWRREPPPPEDQTASRPMTSETCFKCHESHFASWHRTFHRTMTREATPENVKGPFDGTPHEFMGVTTRLIREGDQFFMDTVDPAWETQNFQKGIARDKAGPAPRRKLSVDLLVGSHWVQQMLNRDEYGRYQRLPMMYHIEEKRWIHINGRFLAPDSENFFARAGLWNQNCLFCHNTRPIMNPKLDGGGQVQGFNTVVGELGISCEACHGAGERHVRAHQNPAKRLAQHFSGDADPTIVNPAKLSVKRADDVCAHCHSGAIPRQEKWNRRIHAEPFLAGRDLRRFWYLPYSDEDRDILQKTPDTGACCDLAGPHPPGPLDGRFWPDGTPLSTATEYPGMATSACYEKGSGKMSCLTCHAMHNSDPNHQVKEGMLTNEACYSCHETYRKRLVEHTHHPAGSEGSLCYNCHMPHQVFGLLSTRRTHRITIPRVRDSVGTGKPHACNLCHLDKSLGWTQEHLGTWYGTKPEPLSDDERKFASSLMHLAQGDARSRAVVAGAFSWAPAQQASGRDWPVLLLTRTLEHERYQVVRYLAHKALRSLHGPAANDYDYQGLPDKRAAQLGKLKMSLESTVQVDPSRYPCLPLTPAGLFADDVFERLLKARKDPDVQVRE